MYTAYVSRGDVAEAENLMAHLGADALAAAAERARRSRTIGNHIAFCRWRQIERLIAVLNAEESFGTVH